MFAITAHLSIRRTVAFTTIATFIIITTLFSACSSPKSCPAFSDPELETWFPYRTGHQYYFRGSNGVVDSLQLTAIDKSTPYTSGNHYESFACSEGATLTSGNNSSGVRFNVSETEVDGQIAQTEINVDGMYYFATHLSDTGYVSSNSPYGHTVYHTSVTLDGHTYNQVQEIISDDARPADLLSRIWIGKNQGLVGYEFKNGGGIYALEQ